MRLLLSAMLLSLASQGFSMPANPVYTGGESDLDACGAAGFVEVDTILLTHTESGPEFSRIEAGTWVSFCDSYEGWDDKWQGVVIQQEGVDCGTGSPRAERGPYEGPCKSGWVKEQYTWMIAG